MGKKKIVIAAAALLVCAVIVFVLAQKITGDRFISQVRDQSPNGYPAVTYGQAFGAWYGSPSWSYSRENGDDIVTFTGQRDEGNGPVTVQMRYKVLKGKFWPVSGTAAGEELDAAQLGSWNHRPFADYHQ